MRTLPSFGSSDVSPVRYSRLRDRQLVADPVAVAQAEQLGRPQAVADGQRDRSPYQTGSSATAASSASCSARVGGSISRRALRLAVDGDARTFVGDQLRPDADRRGRALADRTSRMLSAPRRSVAGADQLDAEPFDVGAGQLGEPDSAERRHDQRAG